MSFSFSLPSDLIAQTPVSPRDHARLLVYDRSSKKLTDDYFYNLAAYLPKNTLVVANNSKVEHCRMLFCGGKIEIFAVEKNNHITVRALVRPGKVFKQGSVVDLGDGLIATVKAVDDDGLRTIEFNVALDDAHIMAAQHVPLPPYITQNDTLAAEYQTIYSKPLGSLAAPTAGLHFTPELKELIEEDYGWAEVTLHVGLGTFKPLEQSNFESGKLHSEWYEIPSDVAGQINAAKHVTAVGTTSCRTLESAFVDGMVQPGSGDTSIFIQPGYQFKRVNSLITNFHLPGTSLLLLVEAFLESEDELRSIYSHAIQERYRFYSFGDAMLII